MEDQKPTASPDDQQNAAAAGDAQQTVPQDDGNHVGSAQAADLATQLEAAQIKAQEHYEMFLRAKAEGENIRRRAQEDVAKAHKFAIESFAEYLLPVMDSLHAALADTSGDLAKLHEGVELTQRQLVAALEKGRIVELNPVGEKFDPHLHQAISMVPSEQEPNTVVAVLQRGYTIAERVLRPALVTVSAPR
ncbi:MAG TPA: nucleotide exchange factor GrpE [Burkholderiaceae bacterium]|jgi:molecular chaperone GrpE|nr:nucleotide exchange factor GrpE [Burkholderiaceae bacterium]